jgi:hypothetical protein
MLRDKDQSSKNSVRGIWCLVVCWHCLHCRETCQPSTYLESGSISMSQILWVNCGTVCCNSPVTRHCSSWLQLLLSDIAVGYRSCWNLYYTRTVCAECDIFFLFVKWAVYIITIMLWRVYCVHWWCSIKYNNLYIPVLWGVTLCCLASAHTFSVVTCCSAFLFRGKQLAFLSLLASWRWYSHYDPSEHLDVFSQQ